MREISALARSNNPEKASWKGVRSAILDATTFLRLETNQLTAPIRLGKIAKLRHICNTTFFSDRCAPEAILVPVPEGFVIRLPSGLLEARYRFSIAHEIGHTFFYDLTMSPPVRLIEWKPSGMLSQKEEDICKAFARDLLLPSGLVDAELEVISSLSKLDLLLHLARRFIVSAECAVIRLLWDLSRFETVVVVFRDVNTRRTDGSMVRSRRYYGKDIKHPRKDEQKILRLVTDVIMHGPPFDFLKEIAVQNRDIVSLEWKLTRALEYRGVFVLLDFHR
jgi:hypothetical protein